MNSTEAGNDYEGSAKDCKTKTFSILSVQIGSVQTTNKVSGIQSFSKPQHTKSGIIESEYESRLLLTEFYFVQK